MSGSKEENKKQIKDKIPPRKNKTQWDSSVIIALIAVLISSASVFISLKESNILVDQQDASVWPYLESFSSGDYPDDSTALFTYIVTNKGIGPAIIDDVSYFYLDSLIDIYDLGEILRKEFPSLSIFQTQKSDLSKVVLSPNNTHKLTTIKIYKKETANIGLAQALQTLNQNLKLQYCYCSVYGKCWFVSSIDQIEKSNKCTFRSDIR